MGGCSGAGVVVPVAPLVEKGWVSGAGLFGGERWHSGWSSGASCPRCGVVWCGGGCTRRGALQEGDGGEKRESPDKKKQCDAASLITGANGQAAGPGAILLRSREWLSCICGCWPPPIPLPTFIFIAERLFLGDLISSFSKLQTFWLSDLHLRLI